jgi:hypothetical protein
MVLAFDLIVLAVLLGLGGLLFTAVKSLLIVAVVLLIAGAVAGVLGRGKTRKPPLSCAVPAKLKVCGWTMRVQYSRSHRL